MPQLWLRIAALLYGAGTLYALIALLRRREISGKVLAPLGAAGVLLHFVAVAETTLTGEFVPALSKQSESLLAFVLVLFFLAVYFIYKTASHGLFVFPLATLLTASAAVGHQQQAIGPSFMRSGWIYFHIALIFAGYAALLFSFLSSIFYLLQERRLKSKDMGSGLLGKLPSLAVIDDIGQSALVLGFPFMTLGMIAGAVLAASTFGRDYFHDPKVVLSLLMWAVYMLLLFTRWTAGWRGRRAAILSAVAFICATGAWAANYIGFAHRVVER
jgi:ABC-type uncharacterized transport system permease subunit